jgi:hypothetical protein
LLWAAVTIEGKNIVCGQQLDLSANQKIMSCPMITPTDRVEIMPASSVAAVLPTVSARDRVYLNKYKIL